MLTNPAPGGFVTQSLTVSKCPCGSYWGRVCHSVLTSLPYLEGDWKEKLF